MVTKWQGLWEQEEKDVYSSYIIKKADIPKYTKIILRKNKYYKKDSNRPKFIYCFADSKDYYESKSVPIEFYNENHAAYLDNNGHYYTKYGDRLYTIEEAIQLFDPILHRKK